ncbi:MAG: hypothetical protein RIC30_19840 [Marinoscillum sp.]|uniref:hypothetical protein n=1 Tax=Marinoscillum sp. TaxID=2024838 RepID=UPI00330096F1
MERQILFMTDEEFDVLDELYFVTPFGALRETTGWTPAKLIPVLDSIYRKGWIKVMKTIDDELPEEQIDLNNHADEYFFLATKSGLLAHNS